MTHIMIEDNTPEGKWLLELIRGHKSVTVMDEKKKKGFREAVAECNGRPAAEFFIIDKTKCAGIQNQMRLFGG